MSLFSRLPSGCLRSLYVNIVCDDISTGPWRARLRSLGGSNQCAVPEIIRTFKTSVACYVRGRDVGYLRRRTKVLYETDDSDQDPSDKSVHLTDDGTCSNEDIDVKQIHQPERRSLPPKQPSRRLLKSIMDDAAQFDVPSTSEVDGSWSTPHYPLPTETIAKLRLQGRHAPPLKPGIDPEHVTVILFPGQGAQYPGMAKSLLGYPNVRRMYDVASDILGYDLLDVCLKGVRDDLNRTIYCQPATVVASLAALEKLKDETPHAVENCIATAGFSVGEITSLIFANVLDFESGMKLVRIYAEAMQAASEMTSGGMMSLFFGASGRIGFACTAAKEWCVRQGIEDAECRVAHYLYPGCKVVSGHNEALNFIARNAKEFHIDRYKRLQVSGAFHSSLMLPAATAIAQAMKKIRVADPLITVYSNAEGRPYRDAAHIRRALAKQPCKAVRWEQLMHSLYERPIGTGFPATYECGPGRALQMVLQKVNAKAHARSQVIAV